MVEVCSDYCCDALFCWIIAFADMTERIGQYVKDSVGDSLYNKAVKCLKTLRSAAISEDDEVSFALVIQRVVRERGSGDAK